MRTSGGARGGGGRLEEAAVVDVLGAVGDDHGDGGHEQVHHLADHPPHHQRIHEPRHDDDDLNLAS